MSKKISQLDANLVIRKAWNDQTDTLDFSMGNSLVVEEFDDSQMGYTGSELTSVIYLKDGAQVAELALEYTLGNLTRVR